MKKGSVEFSGTFCMLKTSKWVQCLLLLLFWEFFRKKVKPSCPSLLLSWFWHFWQEKHPVTLKRKGVQLLLMGIIYVSSFLLFVMFIWDMYVGCACTVYIYMPVCLFTVCVCACSLCVHLMHAQFMYMYACVFMHSLCRCICEFTVCIYACVCECTVCVCVRERESV